MTTVTSCLWVNPNWPDSDRGQERRRCLIQYRVGGIGAKEPYTITSITDARTGQTYDIPNTLALQEKELDVSALVLAKPEMVSAAKGLAEDLKRETKPKGLKKPKHSQSTEILPDEPELLPP
jgi:hypothetical protein